MFDPISLPDDALVDAIVAWDRVVSWAQAGQLAAIAELVRRRPAGPGEPGDGSGVSEFAVDEVAAALRLSRPAAGARLRVAVELTGRLPATAAALRRGEIDFPKARAVVDAVTPLDDLAAASVEARVLPRAGRQTVGQLRASLARAVLSADPAAAEDRHARAVTDRKVTLTPLSDGMAELWALLPADAAAAVYSAIDIQARRSPADARSMDARRADALADLITATAVTETAVDASTVAATRTPSSTATTAGTATSTGSSTPVSTATATSTGTPASTRTATSMGTGTATSTATSTPASTGTTTYNGAGTGISTPASTGTAISTATSTSTPASTGTVTSTGTNTPASTGSAIGTGTGTGAPASTRTGTSTGTGTATSTPASTGTATSTATSTGTPASTGTTTGSSASTSAGVSRRGPARPLVHVTVAASTLLGLDDEPGDLAGHGPIPASMARRIAADPTGTWRRILTDPATGAVLDVGRNTYRPPPAVVRHVTTRDRTCRFPGCRQPAHRCDLDHIRPYPAGPTAASNLATLCRHHHRLKHHGSWQITHTSNADLTWTAPTGHRYTTHPQPAAPPTPTTASHRQPPNPPTSRARRADRHRPGAHTRTG
ncbi:MAG TPA: DUF222 domain-containing protein [Mycobacteriales bacterium]|nr:DUF222 domain-containing protein [Mycobacteriales bacterium]